MYENKLVNIMQVKNYLALLRIKTIKYKSESILKNFVLAPKKNANEKYNKARAQTGGGQIGLNHPPPK